MRQVLLGVLVFGFLSGCSNSSTPGGPTPSSLNVTGTWSGGLTVQGQQGRMTWTLTQSGSTVTGPVLVGLPSGVILLNGTLTGSLTGTTLTYSINIAQGGIPTQPSCTGRLDCTAAVTQGTPSTMAGTYTVATSTCTTGFTTGDFTLTR